MLVQLKIPLKKINN